jgi:hypothetical protein
MANKDKVVSLISKADKENDKYQEELTEVAMSFMDMVTKKEIKEFVIVYVTDEGNVSISSFCKDMVGSIGMMELGKAVLLSHTE